MKKMLFMFVAIATLSMTSCGNKTNANVSGNDTVTVDSINADSVVVDSVVVDSVA